MGRPAGSPPTGFGTIFGGTAGSLYRSLVAKGDAPVKASRQPDSDHEESDVAEAVWLAANDTSDRLHYPAGPDAVALAGAG